ncbi:MAG: hypothetical protein ACRD82_08445, partial [Blastocatellia bacterium]
PKADKVSLSRTLLHVAWMAILLGLIVEALILIVVASFGSLIAGKPVLADLVQKVSWSVIVCMGLALARGATRLFAATAQTALVGLAGLLTAPAAFAIARSLHEGVQEALFIKVFQGGGGSPVMLALIKGIEYGCLGALLVWVGGKIWGKAMAHAGVGLVIGVIFGAVLIVAMAWGAKSPMSLGAMISRAINEVINPVGCSLTLYSAEILGRTQTISDAATD